MIYIKYFLGLLLLVTVIWLSKILLNFLNIYYLTMVITLFLILTYRKKIPLLKNTITLLVIIFIFYSSSLTLFQQKSLNLNEKNWINFFEINIDELVKENDIIFLDITADWCATCQYNKINVLNTNAVLNKFIENKVTLIRADWTKPSKEIDTYLKKYNRYGIPFNAFFSSKYPSGLLLSEILSEKLVLDSIEKIK